MREFNGSYYSEWLNEAIRVVNDEGMSGVSASRTAYWYILLQLSVDNMIHLARRYLGVPPSPSCPFHGAEHRYMCIACPEYIVV